MGQFDLFFRLSCQHSLLHDLLYLPGSDWSDQIECGDYQKDWAVTFCKEFFVVEESCFDQPAREVMRCAYFCRILHVSA